MIKLSKRLQSIATYIPKGAIVADIGSDHAYLCSHICLTDSTAQAIAVEVRPGPFEAAKHTINKHHLQNRIDIRLGDGLDVIDYTDQVDTVVIAGMGGKLITDIINKNMAKIKNVERLILQPNTNAELVRELFIESDFSLGHEVIMEESNHIYEILVFENGVHHNPYNPSVSLEKQIYFGPMLMKENSNIFQKKLLGEQNHLKGIITQLEKQKIAQHDHVILLKKRIAWMEEILN